MKNAIRLIFALAILTATTGCEKEPDLPIVRTIAVTDITSNSAIGSGILDNDGNANSVTSGFTWSESPNPIINSSDSWTGYNHSIGSYSTNISNLTPNTTYFARAYARNSSGTTYGEQIQFTTSSTSGGGGSNCQSSVTDIDGNVYQVVTIGNQCWMTQNLRTTRFNNGQAIPQVIDNAVWTSTSSAASASYNNNIANDIVHGKLYNWYAVGSTNGLCPQGWHVPSDDEWMQLELALGMPFDMVHAMGPRGNAQQVGGKMKAISSLWSSPNSGATNQSEFYGLPSGLKHHIDGAFDRFGLNALWWTSSTGQLSQNAWYRMLSHDNAAVTRSEFNKRSGYCVRCIKD